jgi:nucleotide-binding universal stress UspA family protein
MAKQILVPLDRTHDAEAIIPLVQSAAHGAGATVRLLHVAPVPELIMGAHGRVIAYTDQETARMEADALDYLRTIAARLEPVATECAVRFGDPVREILADAEAFGADLVAVTTTGRSAVGRAVLGSVAEGVFRRVGIDVMLFGPAPTAGNC